MAAMTAGGRGWILVHTHPTDSTTAMTSHLHQRTRPERGTVPPPAGTQRELVIASLIRCPEPPLRRTAS